MTQRFHAPTARLPNPQCWFRAPAAKSINARICESDLRQLHLTADFQTTACRYDPASRMFQLYLKIMNQEKLENIRPLPLRFFKKEVRPVATHY
jgi:hypothetical protein